MVVTVPPELEERLSITLAAFARIGIDSQALWAPVARSAKRRGHSSLEALARADLAEFRAVYSEAYFELPPFSAMFAAAEVPVGAYSVVDYLTASCSTLAVGLAHLARYFGVLGNQLQLRVREHAEQAHVDVISSYPPKAYGEEWMIGVTVQRFRKAVGRDFPLLSARFSRPVGAPLEEAARFLGCTPTLEHAEPGFSLDRETYQSPLLLRDDRLRSMLERHAAQLLLETTSSNQALVGQAREELSKQLPQGTPSIQRLGKTLGLSARTLQRRLAEEGLNFQTLLDNTRAELADRYLESEALPVAEVAFLLGYSEPSAFARAYRRWRGRSPTVVAGRGVGQGTKTGQ